MPKPGASARVLVAAAVYLALGAVVTVMVAWACTLWSPLGTAPEEFDGSVATGGSLSPVGLGRMVRYVPAEWFEARGRTAVYVHGSDGRGFGVRDRSLQLVRFEWPHRTHGDWPVHDGAFFREFLAGWPAKAIRCSGQADRWTAGPAALVWTWRPGWSVPLHLYAQGAAETSSTRVILEHLIVAPGAPMPPAPAPLPLRPLWPGFAVNTLMYAALFAALRFAPPGLQRLHRRRRGLCLSCGYSRASLAGDAACPECGTGVSK